MSLPVILQFTPEVDVAPEFACDDTIIEVWQPPDAARNLRIRGYAVTKPFGVPDPTTGAVDDTALTACDARLVLYMAMANAKAHYGKADAQVAANELKTMLYKLRAGRAGNYRFFAVGADEAYIPPPPPKYVP